jgi:hypothetical protein
MFSILISFLFRNLDLLLITLFDILGRRLTQPNRMEPQIVAEIVILTVRIATAVGYKTSWHTNIQIYKFCAMFPNPRSDVWTKTLSSVLILAKGEESNVDPPVSADVAPLYRVLEYFGTDGDQPWNSDTANVFAALLLALAGSLKHPKPSDTALRVVLEALSQPTAAYPAFLFLCRTESWILDDRLRRMMQNHSVWTILGETALKDPDRMGKEYIELGDKLSRIPEWIPHIRSDACGWINNYVQMDPSKRQKWQRHQFESVLQRVWKAYVFETVLIEGDEHTLKLVFTTLSNAWAYLDFSEAKTKTEGFFRLARCTASTALAGRYANSQYPLSGWHEPPEKVVEKPLTADFKNKYFKVLGKAFAGAIRRARSTQIMSAPSLGVASDADNACEMGQLNLEDAAMFLEEMRNQLGGEAERAEDVKESEESSRVQQEREYWSGLRERFLRKLDILEKT